MNLFESLKLRAQQVQDQADFIILFKAFFLPNLINIKKSYNVYSFILKTEKLEDKTMLLIHRIMSEHDQKLNRVTVQN